MMKYYLRLFLIPSAALVVSLTLCLLSMAAPAQARDTEAPAPQTIPQVTSQTEPLRVGIFHKPPFAIEGASDWDGIGVHLWREAAQEMGVPYEWRAITEEEVAQVLEDGAVDLVIGAVANAEDEGIIDFTQSYHVSSIGVAEPAQRTLLELARALFSPRFWRIALWLSIAFMFVGVIAWAFERNANEEQFGPGVAYGIWSGFWWAGVTMSTIGYGDKAPKTIGGRIVALIWMLVAMGITASLTASLTSVLALGTGLSATRFPGDLRHMTVGSMEMSESAEFLRTERIRFQAFETVDAGLEGVSGGELEVFVDDAAALRYVNNESMRGMLRINETGVSPQHHAFALSKESDDLREQLNQIILTRLADPGWHTLIERYVPQETE